MSGVISAFRQLGGVGGNAVGLSVDGNPVSSVPFGSWGVWESSVDPAATYSPEEVISAFRQLGGVGVARIDSALGNDEGSSVPFGSWGVWEVQRICECVFETGSSLPFGSWGMWESVKPLAMKSWTSRSSLPFGSWGMWEIATGIG